MRLAALVCDIGNARIPATVLEKRGPLTAEEWEAVRRHPEHSAAMLSGPGFDDVRVGPGLWTLRLLLSALCGLEERQILAVAFFL